MAIIAYSANNIKNLLEMRIQCSLTITCKVSIEVCYVFIAHFYKDIYIIFGKDITDLPQTISVHCKKANTFFTSTYDFKW